MEVHASFRKIPDDAKLIRFGNCFRYNNANWNIGCEFELPDKAIQNITLSIECLPALAIGRQYKKGAIVRPKGRIAEIDLPPISAWSVRRYEDYHKFTSRSDLAKDAANQYVFRFKLNDYYVWLPSIELARALFLKTAISTRVAFTEANLNRLIDVVVDGTTATLRLSEFYPHKLLDVKAHQSYLAWLMLNQPVLHSYLSIFRTKFEKAYNGSSFQSWAFHFEPFELENVFIRAYTRIHGQNIFIEEISSVANLPVNKDFELINFDHPLDIKLEAEPVESSKISSRVKPNKDKFDPEVVEDEAASNETRARVLSVPKGALYFNEVINTQRIFKIKIVETSGGGTVGESTGERVRLLSVREGQGKGKHTSADFQSIAGEDSGETTFFTYIRKALSELREIEHLGVSNIEIKLGTLPTASAKRFLYIRPSLKRSFLYAEIEIVGGDSLHLLEIDLSDDHSLTTLIFRQKSKDDVHQTIFDILAELVNNSGRWDRRLISKQTLMQAYVMHPKDLKPSTSAVVFQNWAKRIASEF